MNRQIKFKAKRLDNDQWVEGDLIHSTSYVGISYPSDEFPDVPIVHRIDPSTICQYTRLKDKDGKEIWEHDILVWQGEDEYTIEYRRASFVFINEEGINIGPLRGDFDHLKKRLADGWSVLCSKFDKEEKE